MGDRLASQRAGRRTVPARPIRQCRDNYHIAPRLMTLDWRGAGDVVGGISTLSLPASAATGNGWGCFRIHRASRVQRFRPG
jgi:hypothetical protein